MKFSLITNVLSSFLAKTRSKYFFECDDLLMHLFYTMFPSSLSYPTVVPFRFYFVRSILIKYLISNEY